jgi:hypothetical protein
MVLSSALHSKGFPNKTMSHKKKKQFRAWPLETIIMVNETQPFLSLFTRFEKIL